MEVGGDSYKQLKEQLDKATKDLNELERTLTRNKTTLSSSDNTVKKMEADLKRLQDEIVNLNLAGEQLAKEIIKNDEAG